MLPFKGSGGWFGVCGEGEAGFVGVIRVEMGGGFGADGLVGVARASPVGFSFSLSSCLAASFGRVETETAESGGLEAKAFVGVPRATSTAFPVSFSSFASMGDELLRDAGRTALRRLDGVLGACGFLTGVAGRFVRDGDSGVGFGSTTI